MLTLDGSFGEGGGQVLRTSLSLSVATGRPFRIEKIRAGRERPGLLRQHLTAVQAAARISGGTTEGAELNSTELTFLPGPVRAGEYEFSIGTAGSTTLVLQTVLPPLLRAAGPSTITLRGGTHNLAAPPFEFLEHAFLPQLRAMGCRVDAVLVRPGFFPAGGGELQVFLEPAVSPRARELLERGPPRRQHAVVQISKLRGDIARRECKTLEQEMGWPSGTARVHQQKDSPGPGNLVTVHLEFEHVTEVVTAFGRRGVAAEQVAREAAREALTYLRSPAPVGEHLADQLVLPMALLAGGRFVTGRPSSHLTTNLATVRQFLGDVVTLREGDDGAWTVEVTAG